MIGRLLGNTTAMSVLFPEADDDQIAHFGEALRNLASSLEDDCSLLFLLGVSDDTEEDAIGMMVLDALAAGTDAILLDSSESWEPLTELMRGTHKRRGKKS